MRPFLSLLKTNLNVYFGISALKYRFTKEKKRLWEPILLLFSIVIGGGTLVVMYSLMLLGVFIGGQAIGRPEIVITLSFMASQLLILIFGIFYIISVFYFSNDMDMLIPLPLSQAEVMGAKFITILISEYLIVLPLLLPAFIIYGAGSWAGILYWFKGLILVLMAPVLPLVIAAIFVILLMRFVNIRKSKDLMVVIGSILGLFLGLGINLITQRFPEGNEKEFIKGLIESNSGLIEAIGNRFPPSIWATYSLSRPGWEGWSNFFLFIGISLLFLVALVWLGNRFFYRGYLSGQEIRRKSKGNSKGIMKKESAKISSPITALFLREWRLFIRTPIYVMNGLAGIIIVPFFMFMPLITGSEDLKKIIEYAREPKYALMTVLIAFGILLFASSMNTITSTAISREGRTFWISRIIPATPKQQIWAKLLHGASLVLVQLIIIALPLYFVLRVSLLRLLVIILLGFLANGLISILSLMVDVFRPKLDWNDPQEAMKQNLNVFFGMLISLLVMGILGGISVLMMLNNASEGWIYTALTATIILLSIPSLYGLFFLADRGYNGFDI